MRRMTLVGLVGLVGLSVVFGVPAGCKTAPKGEKRAEFLSEARHATAWFENNVNGLKSQIDKSAGYIIFPDIFQFGIIFGGGTFGRGALCKPDGTQIGWARMDRGSAGLQAGVQGFRMLILLENEKVLDQFKKNELTGSVSGQLVVAKAGGSGAVQFKNGVAVYQGANKGLMAGVSVGLEYIRHQPLAGGEVPGDTR